VRVPSLWGRLSQPAVLALLAGLNLLVTVGYQWLPVARLGVGVATDALFVSAIVPQVILSVVSSGLTSVLTPLLATADADRFRVQAWTYAHGVGLAALALNGVLFLAAPWWVTWLVPGFEPSARALTVGLVRAQLVGALATMLLMVAWSADYARRRFVWVETSGILAGIIGLGVAAALLPRYGVHAIAWAMSLRSVLQLALLVPGWGRYARPDWRAAGGGTAFARLLPLMGGATYYKLDPMVERVLASFAPAGHLSLLHLAQQASAAGNQIITKAIVNPIMPALAEFAAARSWPDFARLTWRRLTIVLTVTAAAWTAMALVGRPMLDLVLGRWLVAADIALLHLILVALGGVWLAGAAGQVLTVGFFALGDTRTPTTVGVVGFTVGIPLKIVCYWGWGVVGLAIATSAYTAGNAVAHHLLLRRGIRRRAAIAAVPVPSPGQVSA
jgi:peptidoglycan biosynthesis protein MviN/MurJ (putative lipid II flippase)